MTALQSLSISHFRSHRLTRLAPEGASVVLYGPNGAGKTNILEAVSMMSPGRGMRRANASEMVRRPDGIGWKVIADVDGHELQSWTEATGSRHVRIDGKNSPQVNLGRHLSVVWLTPSMDRLWTEGAEGRRRFLDRIVLSFDSDHGEASLAYEKSMRERNRLLKDHVSDESWYSALEAQMANFGSKIESARDDAVARLVAAQIEGETEFPHADLTLIGPEQAPRLTTEDNLLAAFSASRNADLRAGRTLVGPHRTDMEAVFSQKSVAAKEASTGEQKAMLISLVLANARSLKTENRIPVILLDEVSAHLDENRRAALFKEIKNLGAQAWMTGTGAELFDDVDSSCRKYEVRDFGDGSEVSLIGD